MLSTFATLSVNSAKHLDAHPDRPFAAAQGDKKGPPSLVVADPTNPGIRMRAALKIQQTPRL